MKILALLAVIVAASILAGCDQAPPVGAEYSYTTINTDIRTRFSGPELEAAPDFALEPGAGPVAIVIGAHTTAVPLEGRFDVRPWLRSGGAWTAPAGELELELGQAFELPDVAGADALWLEIVKLDRVGPLELGVSPALQ